MPPPRAYFLVGPDIEFFGAEHHGELPRAVGGASDPGLTVPGQLGAAGPVQGGLWCKPTLRREDLNSAPRGGIRSDSGDTEHALDVFIGVGDVWQITELLVGVEHLVIHRSEAGVALRHCGRGCTDNSDSDQQDTSRSTPIWAVISHDGYLSSVSARISLLSVSTSTGGNFIPRMPEMSIHMRAHGADRKIVPVLWKILLHF